MPSFKATNQLTAEIISYDAALPEPEHLGDGWRLEEIINLAAQEGQEPEPEPDTRLFGGRRKVSKLELIALLGDTAYKAILAAGKVSVDIEAWIKLLELAEADQDGNSIDLDDARTQTGIIALGQMLETQEVVSEGWAEKVLNG